MTLWRSLKRLGAATLTPGAALLPFREELLEQLDWLAQDIEEQGGDAWVLPVMDLIGAEHARVVQRMNDERQAEYDQLRLAADDLLRSSPRRWGPQDDHQHRVRAERELLALRRRFRKIRGRDYFAAPGRMDAERAIDRCCVLHQGSSTRLLSEADAPTVPAR